jgi:hypothetical protein
LASGTHVRNLAKLRGTDAAGPIRETFDLPQFLPDSRAGQVGLKAYVGPSMGKKNERGYGPRRLAPLPPIRCVRFPLFFGLSGQLGRSPTERDQVLAKDRVRSGAARVCWHCQVAAERPGCRGAPSTQARRVKSTVAHVAAWPLQITGVLEQAKAELDRDQPARARVRAER